MEEQVFLLNMFAEYDPPEALQDALSQAAIAAADIDPETRKVSVAVHADTYIPQRLLDEAARDICDVYELKQMQLVSTHPADQLHRIEPEELMGLFVQQNSMTRGSLAGGRWEWEGSVLTVSLKANGKAELEECIPYVVRRLQEKFGTQVSVQIQAGETLEGQALFAAMEKMRADALENIPLPAGAPVKKQETQQQSEAFFGKPFKGNAVPMDTLSLDMGSVIVEGKVFDTEHKDLSKSNATVINFDMTDNRG